MATTSRPTDKLRDQATQVAGSVGETTNQAARSVKANARDAANARLDAVAEQAATVAGVLRQAGQQLREKQQPMLAGQADHLATRIDGVSGHLRASSIDDLVTEAEDYARRRPALVLGAAAVAGFAVARLLKAGSAAAPRPQPVASDLPAPGPAYPRRTPATPVTTTPAVEPAGVRRL